MDAYINNTPNVVSLPKSFIKRHILHAPADEVKALILIIANAGDEICDVAEATGLCGETLNNAIKYWSERGVININEDTGDIEVDFHANTDTPTRIGKNRDTVTDVMDKIEAHIGRQLSFIEVQVILHISKDMEFSDELLVYLATYCFDRDKFYPNYMKKVAETWQEKGIQTPEEAKSSLFKYPKEVYSYLSQLGRNEFVSSIEKETVNRWIEEYKLEKDLIQEIIKLSMKSASPHKVMYADNLAVSYFNEGIHSLEEKYSSESKPDSLEAIYGRKINI